MRSKDHKTDPQTDGLLSHLLPTASGRLPSRFPARPKDSFPPPVQRSGLPHAVAALGAELTPRSEPAGLPQGRTTRATAILEGATHVAKPPPVPRLLGTENPYRFRDIVCIWTMRKRVPICPPIGRFEASMMPDERPSREVVTLSENRSQPAYL